MATFLTFHIFLLDMSKVRNNKNRKFSYDYDDIYDDYEEEEITPENSKN